MLTQNKKKMYNIARKAIDEDVNIRVVLRELITWCEIGK